jgi:DNA polymerase I-like protein with 3'-5' exonuclease and polymerase domains
MKEIEEKKRLDRKRAYPMMFVHDELIYCVQENYMEEARDVVIGTMENLPFEDFGFTMSVPLVAECEEGQNLAVMNEF